MTEPTRDDLRSALRSALNAPNQHIAILRVIEALRPDLAPAANEHMVKCKAAWSRAHHTYEEYRRCPNGEVDVYFDRWLAAAREAESFGPNT